MSQPNPTIRAEYRKLFDTLEIRAERARAVDKLCARALALVPVYEPVSRSTGVPWYFIAAVHLRESTFKIAHLHNGDPLSARTVHVPAGRPKTPEPPYTFEQSAEDALRLKKLHQWQDWSLTGTLYQLERYNGLGYRRLGKPSPYLWSFSHHYQHGKYIADGQYSDTAIDAQCGSTTFLRRLVEQQQFNFPDEPDLAIPTPLAVNYATKRPTDPGVIERATALQIWLNSHPGIYLKVDGWPGERTSNAFRKVTGSYLPGDPRA
jgi:lysozyme family protein